MMMRASFLAAFSLISSMLSGCGSEEPPPKKVELPKTCVEKFGGGPAWAISDQSALQTVDCKERASGLWACNQRGEKYVCFDCNAVKTTFDPTAVGPGSLKALGVDDAEMATLQSNYDTGCLTTVDWDQYAPDAFTGHLLCKEAMTGLKVCRNIDGERQWWNMGGAKFTRATTHGTIGNSKGTVHTLVIPAAQVDVLDIAQWPFVACESLTATKDAGWDLSIGSKDDLRTFKLNLVEPNKAAAAPEKADFERLATAFTTCDASYGNWE
ncbi:MAG: hypothetical protein KC502_21630 [Myxococcales bacterium]|nr:hypothetical protein [Myxococcales bacterium]